MLYAHRVPPPSPLEERVLQRVGAPPNLRLAFVDLETSGLSPGADRITEIGVVTVDDGGVEEWTTLVNPGRDLTERSRFYNGITSHELANAPRVLVRDLLGELDEDAAAQGDDGNEADGTGRAVDASCRRKEARRRYRLWRDHTRGRRDLWPDAASEHY
jgi:hypothetical protein